jgi:dTDP-4-amino-4,6-dideoxygalactose transaminase
MINVTKTFFPPIDEYHSQIKRIWKNGWLTNRGELLCELEIKLIDYLKTSNIIILNNGTIPLQIALKLLGSNGEIITTPFSYVATTSSIIWENCTPVFADIHPEYLTIDEEKIEEVITNNTTAILATHVFGNPCNVEAIEKIAKKYRLKVIYDAAHSFGVTYKGKSLFSYGDISSCSFHATKLFHTGEGGALFCSDEELRNKAFYSHNFGHNGPLNFHGLGINGKMSELQAAMGLSVLPYMNDIINYRKKIVNFYNESISEATMQFLKIRKNTDWNYSYYPIIFESEEKLLGIQKKLNQKNIFPRRYFYPSLNSLEYLDYKSMPISEDISKRVLCLPLYYGLDLKECKTIIEIINS